jgi:very-short-patch-repair endonuclease
VTFASKPQRIAHTRAEKELHKLLVLEPFSVPLKTQAPEGRCRLDFFFPDWKLAIEIDGPWHDPDADKKRDDGLGKIGISVLRLPADMPASQMRRHIAYVSQRILYLQLPEKLQFVRNYKPAILDRLQGETKKQAASVPQESCVDCGGSGWKLVPYWSNFLQRAEQRATRCECKNLRDDNRLALVSEDVTANHKPPAQVGLFGPREKLA